MILSTGFSQSDQKIESDKLYKIHKRVVEHEKNIGKDSAFYNVLDSFKIQLDSYTNKFGYDDVYHNIAVYWGGKYADIDPNASIEFLKENLSHAKKDKKKYAIAANQYKLGEIFFNLKQIENAISYYNQTAEIYKELEDWNKYAYCLMDIADAYFSKGKFHISSSYYDKAFNVFKDKLDEENFYKGASLCFTNKGLLNEYEDNFESALINYKLALDYKIKNKKENSYSSVYLNIASVYESLNNNDSALYYYSLAVKNDEYNQSNDELFNSYNKLGDFYLKNNEFDKSKELYNKAYYLSINNNQELNQAVITETLGDFFIKIEQIDSAIFYYEKSCDISLKNNILIKIKDVCIKLYNIYFKLREPENQLKYIKILFDIEKQKDSDNFSKMQLKYKFNTSIKERELLELKSQRKLFFIIGISSIALLIVTIVFLVLRQRKKIKKIKSQLEVKNILIENHSKNFKLIISNLKKLMKSKKV